jgi:hypothetical protein
MEIFEKVKPRVDKAFMPCPKGHKSSFYPCVMSFWRKVTTEFTEYLQILNVDFVSL